MTGPIRQAILLAGGRGTRLGDLTDDCPKPLLPVAGRPFLDWLVALLEEQDIQEIVVTTGYRPEVFDEWLENRYGDARVSLHVEHEPLDTGGALCEMGDALHERFFVLNGDTLFDVPLARLAGLLVHGDGVAPSMAVALRRVRDTGRYGAARVRDGRLVSFAEKSGEGPGLINGGVYAMHRTALDNRSAPLSIERTLVPELVRQRRVTAMPCEGFFIDIGVPETYEAAQTEVPRWWATRPTS